MTRHPTARCCCCCCTPIATKANVMILNAVLAFFMIVPAFLTIG